MGEVLYTVEPQYRARSILGGALVYTRALLVVHDLFRRGAPRKQESGVQPRVERYQIRTRNPFRPVHGLF